MNKSLNQAVYDLLVTMQDECSPRNLKVIEKPLTCLEFDPRLCIMDFSSRRFNWKYFAGELWWYLTCELSTDKIRHFSNFWDHLRVNGIINSNYGYIIQRRSHDQFMWALNSLLSDINTRQAIMVFNTPDYQKNGVKDFVCTMYVNFWVRDSKLNMKVQMRSNDIFYGLQYDAPFFSCVHQSMLYHLKMKGVKDLELGTYFHFSDNTHYYERHFDVAKKIIDEFDNDAVAKTPFEFNVFPVLWGNFPHPSIKDFCEEMESIVSDNEKLNSLKQEDYLNILKKYIFINEE